MCALVTVAALTSCSTGFNATSVQPYSPADGVRAQSGQLRALNVLVVASASATSGVVITTVVNDGARDDRLVSVESPDATVTLSGIGDIVAGGTLKLSNDTPTTATVTGLTRLAGETIELTLTYERAEPVSVRTLVVAADGEYAGITPSATAPPSP